MLRQFQVRGTRAYPAQKLSGLRVVYSKNFSRAPFFSESLHWRIKLFEQFARETNLKKKRSVRLPCELVSVQGAKARKATKRTTATYKPKLLCFEALALPYNKRGLSLQPSHGKDILFEILKNGWIKFLNTFLMPGANSYLMGPNQNRTLRAAVKKIHLPLNAYLRQANSK